MRISSTIIFTVAALLAGCSRATVVDIANHSSVTLSNIVVSGSGFSERVTSIAPGVEQRLSVYPAGESGLSVEFDADGRRFDSGQQGYFEGGGDYSVTAMVNTNLKVSVKSNLR